MELVAGEYEFTCTECDGDGSMQAVQLWDDSNDDTEEPNLVPVLCEDCHGAGTVRVDEEEAAEKIECGQTPIRTPAAN